MEAPRHLTLDMCLVVDRDIVPLLPSDLHLVLDYTYHLVAELGKDRGWRQRVSLWSHLMDHMDFVVGFPPVPPVFPLLSFVL